MQDPVVQWLSGSDEVLTMEQVAAVKAELSAQFSTHLELLSDLKAWLEGSPAVDNPPTEQARDLLYCIKRYENARLSSGNERTSLFQDIVTLTNPTERRLQKLLLMRQRLEELVDSTLKGNMTTTAVDLLFFNTSWKKFRNERNWSLDRQKEDFSKSTLSTRLRFMNVHNCLPTGGSFSDYMVVVESGNLAVHCWAYVDNQGFGDSVILLALQAASRLPLLWNSFTTYQQPTQGKGPANLFDRLNSYLPAIDQLYLVP